MIKYTVADIKATFNYDTLAVEITVVSEREDNLVRKWWVKQIYPIFYV